MGALRSKPSKETERPIKNWPLFKKKLTSMTVKFRAACEAIPRLPNKMKSLNSPEMQSRLKKAMTPMAAKKSERCPRVSIARTKPSDRPKNQKLSG